MKIPRTVSGRRRIATVCIAAAIVCAPVAAASAATPTSTGTVSGSTRAAAVQAVLDRVLGTGNSVVTVSDTIQTSSGSTTSVRWGTSVAASSAVTSVTVPGSATAKSVAQQNAVAGTVISTATPPGSLVRQSVSVAVDRAHLAGASLSGLRRLVASAVGLTPSRGDTMSLVVARFAKPVKVSVSAPSMMSILLPFAVPAIWILGGLIGVVMFVRALGGRSRASARLGRS